MNMVRIGFLFLSLALAVSAAGAVAHFYYGLTRADAGLLTLLGVAIAAIYAITLPWRRRGALVQKDSESQAPSTAVLAYRLAEVERRLMDLEVQVRAASLDAMSSEPEQQGSALRERARAELAIAAASLGRR